MVRFLVVVLASLLACGDDAPAPPAPEAPLDVAALLASRRVDWAADERARAIEEGRAALERHECSRCHSFGAEGDLGHVAPAGRSDHCTSCHQWLKGMQPGDRHFDLLASRYGEDVVRRYQRVIDHYQEVPDLHRFAERIEPRWIDEFLREPYDLRPAMGETMPRLALGDADRRAIVRYFAAVAGVADPAAGPAAGPAAALVAPAPSPAALAEGRQLFLTRGCVACHTFGNLDTGTSRDAFTRASLPTRLAPNLRFTRERMSRELVVAWILEPTELLASTRMPKLIFARHEAERLADFLLHADVAVPPAPAAPSLAPPPAVERAVGWAEVKDRVLGRICVHCHMNDHERDLGPGNEGGFGWPGSRLAMRTYEMLVRGAVDPASGERYSVLEPRPGQSEAPLVLAMMTRRHEELRDHVAAFEDHARPAYPTVREGMPLGMPLGLPSIPDDEVALVRAWIAQGCPGPTEVTGMPGITDGLLVPDGPIEPNRGCERRDPADARPSWADQPPPAWERPAERPSNERPSNEGQSNEGQSNERPTNEGQSNERSAERPSNEGQSNERPSNERQSNERPAERSSNERPSNERPAPPTEGARTERRGR